MGGKPSRNELCPCGSGRKYKSCCWPDYSQAPKQWDDSPTDLSTWFERIRGWGYEPKTESPDTMDLGEDGLHEYMEIDLVCPHGRSNTSITLDRTGDAWDWSETGENGEFCPICEEEAKGLRPLCPNCGEELRGDPFLYGCGICGRSFTCGEYLPFKQITPIRRRTF